MVNVPPKSYISSSSNLSAMCEVEAGSSGSNSAYSRDCMNALKVSVENNKLDIHDYFLQSYVRLRLFMCTYC